MCTLVWTPDKLVLNGTVGIQIGVGAFKLAYLSLSPPLSVSLSALFGWSFKCTHR